MNVALLLAMFGLTMDQLAMLSDASVVETTIGNLRQTMASFSPSSDKITGNVSADDVSIKSIETEKAVVAPVPAEVIPVNDNADEWLTAIQIAGKFQTSPKRVYAIVRTHNIPVRYEQPTNLGGSCRPTTKVSPKGFRAVLE